MAAKFSGCKVINCGQNNFITPVTAKCLRCGHIYNGLAVSHCPNCFENEILIERDDKAGESENG